MQKATINPKFMTTAFNIDGFQIVQNLGIVRGISVRSRSIVGNFVAGIQTIFGGNISILTELCDRSRGDAFLMMAEHAAEIGGNAVIGIRYDANDVMPGVAEVLCYGTAVVVAPVRE